MSAFFGQSLEATMSHFGGGIDKFELNFFSVDWSSSWDDRFSEDDWAFSDSHGATFKEEVVVFDGTIVGESTNWGDWLVGQVCSGGARSGALGVSF